MRDPADVIRYALRESSGTILAVREAEAILSALRDEYGAKVAKIEEERPSPDPHTVYVVTRSKRIIPVPVPEGSAS